MSKVVFIPYWIQEQLKRAGLNLNECLDLPKIRPHVSVNDLACFLALQEFSDYLYDGHNQDAVSCGDLYWIWSESTRSNPDESKFFHEQLAAIANSANVRSEVQSRLFTPESKDDRHEKPFITYDIASAVVGVVICPGFFVGAEHQALRLPLVEAVLKLFYAYSLYHEVAKRDVFKKYLTLLSGKSVIV